MPNAKLYVDQRLWSARQADIEALLGPMRDLICNDLSVTPAACQIAAIPCIGLADQPPLNLELAILPKPDRTRDLLTGFGERMRALFAGPMGDAAMAVRIVTLDAATYVAVK